MSSARDVLRTMAGLAHEADASTFLLPKSARWILDPQTVVVLGDRGAGKSAMARFLCEATTPARARLLQEHAPLRGGCFDAFSQQGTAHPDASVLDPLIEAATDAGLRSFWIENLAVFFIRAIARIPSALNDPNMSTMLSQSSDMIADQYVASPKAPSHIDAMAQRNLLRMFDVIESSLGQGESPIGATLVYDDLDTVGAFDITLRTRFIRALLALWTTLSTRYKRIRAKIFLPADLFDLRQFDTLDTNKLLARAARIEWDTPSLYRLVLRHLGRDDAARDWLQGQGISYTHIEDGIGWMPDEVPPEAHRRWLGEIYRPHVVHNGTRGEVSAWIYNRLRDGNGRVSPRSMLTFFRESARAALAADRQDQRRKPLIVEDTLSAIAKVGTDRVGEIRPVYPWVDRLEQLRDRVLPLPRAEVEARLGVDAPSPPRVTDPRDGITVTADLVRMGMLTALREGNRIDLPDVFVPHFGVLRRPLSETPRSTPR